MNSGLRDVLFAVALIGVVLVYDIKSGKINIRKNFSQNCYRGNCSKTKIPYQENNQNGSKNQELGIEKRYRHHPSIENTYVDFDTTHPRGSATLGTAFVIDKKILLSARHVINGCRRSYVVDSKNNSIPIVKTEIQEGTDVALLYVQKPLSLNFFSVNNVDVSSNQNGFHFGFPGEKLGQAYSHFLGQTRMMNSKGYKVDENILVWSVEKQSNEILSGISGGPVFNQDGVLVGVSIAGSLRRGRAYSSDSQTNKHIIDNYQIVQNENNVKRIQVDLENYENLNKELQNDNMIVRVICVY
ncbi:MAG: serine protease [Pseudomonadota bacterium]